MADIFDYIIVGAGSSGCVIAERLSQDADVKILVIEAGGRDSSPLIHMPKGIGRIILDPKHAWYYPVQQPREPGMPAGEAWVRGRGLGGSSAVNGMIYIRGHHDDYDDWERRGATGWNWASMKTAFMAIEDHELGAGDDRGTDGALNISPGKFRYPLADACVEAGVEMGLPRKDDLNAMPQEGVGYYLHNIKNGRRQSAATAFLHPATRRGNVHIMTDAEVDGLIFDGQRVTGVRARRAGQPVELHTRGEVILSAGAMNSPKILQMAGIGNGAHLQSLGIDVKVDNSHVGQHLLEHLGFSMPHRLVKDRGINHRFRGLGLAASVAQYYLTHTGPMATGPFEIGAFARVHPAATRPDCQLFLAGFTFARGGDATFPIQLSHVEDEPGMTIYGQILNLTSEGALSITSPDATQPMDIAPNWLSTEHDQQTAIAMFRYMRRYMQMPAIAPFVGEELVPGPAVQSDEAILQAFRRLSMCGIHGVATCRMGAPGDGVVDPRTRVYGVEGLRVVDCSIMPGLVSGNTNAPAMAAGWHAAQLIRADRRG
ncbi:MAG: GMC family oxidoreductase [Sphingopyxis sp.]